MGRGLSTWQKQSERHYEGSRYDIAHEPARAHVREHTHTHAHTHTHTHTHKRERESRASAATQGTVDKGKRTNEPALGELMQLFCFVVFYRCAVSRHPCRRRLEQGCHAGRGGRLSF